MISRRVIGGIMIILGIILLIIHKDYMNFKFWIESIVFVLIGIVYFTSLSGSYKSEILVSENSMTIKWQGWIRKTIVPDIEIVNITLAREHFLIMRKDKKPLKVFINHLDKEQRTKVFEFLIGYAEKRNLVLNR